MEVPQYVDKVKYVEVPRVVEVPRYRYKYVPKVLYKEVEKVVPVRKIQYRDIPVERRVLCPTPRNVYFLEERKIEKVSKFIKRGTAVCLATSFVPVFKLAKWVSLRC